MAGGLGVTAGGTEACWMNYGCLTDASRVRYGCGLDSMRNVDAIDPIQEVLRDLGPEPLLGDLVGMVPALVSPEDHGVALVEGGPITLDDLVDMLVWLERDQTSIGGIGWEPL